MSETVAEVTIFERIGGAETVDRLVEAFYRRMDTELDARRIRVMHADDLSHTKAVLKRYLTEWLGGPKLYSVEKGHPRLRQRHMGFAIASPDAEAWMLCMRGAMAETIADEAVRSHLDDTLTKLAYWMRNQPDAPEGTQTWKP